MTIRNRKEESIEFKDNLVLNTSGDFNGALSGMMPYKIQVMNDFPEMKLKESDNSMKVVTRWGQMYDIEQILVYAILHLLRQRRQIERFLLKLN